MTSKIKLKASHAPDTPATREKLHHLDPITSINIPSCAPGTSIRGRVEVPLGIETPDFLEGQALPIAEQDCESTLEDPQDDLEAFFSGFVAITPVPSNSSGTCDGLN